MLKKNRLSHRGLLCAAVSLGALAIGARPALAYEYQFNDGTTVQFINTLQYSVLERTAPELQLFANSINSNDGDNNLKAGIVSNRFDLLSKLDISYQNMGFDVSADSFYDTVYNQKTQNNFSLTYNAASDPSTKYTSATETQAGRNIELRNLFVYDTQDIGGVPVTLRVGRLVNLFGESLFFANNGIVYGTAPIDILRATSVPNTQAKDLFLPSGQALLTIQPSDTVTVTAYYQFEWEKYNFIPAGSYFSTVDLLDEGGQRLIAVPSRQIFPGVDTPGLYFYRGKDENGRGTGQMGIAVHYDPPSSSYDLGFYALQYNDSEAQVYVHPNAGPPGFITGTPNALVLGTYNLVYGEGVKIFGMSGSTTYGPVNYAGEISARTNEPLVSSVTVPPGAPANGTNATLYAKGDTLHYQASAIYLGTASPLWEGCSWLTEVAADNLLGFTENRQNFATTQKHMALGLRSLFTANYFHVLPALDIAVPIGIGWNFMGLAPDTQGFNTTGIDRGGDLTVGLSGTYRNVWTGGISYTRYISPPARNPYADRDFLEFNVERSF